MKKEKKRNDIAQQEFESSSFQYSSESDFARGELLYEVTHGVQRRRIFRTSEPH